MREVERFPVNLEADSIAEASNIDVNEIKDFLESGDVLDYILKWESVNDPRKLRYLAVIITGALMDVKGGMSFLVKHVLLFDNKHVGKVLDTVEQVLIKMFERNSSLNRLGLIVPLLPIDLSNQLKEFLRKAFGINVTVVGEDNNVVIN